MKYLEITENGSGRLIFSNNDESIVGLSILNLSTCTGIVIIGKKGISVIHDEGFLKLDGIEEEFNFVGELKQWYIFYNPKYLKGEELNSRYDEMKQLIEKYNGKYKNGKSHFFSETMTGKLFISKESPEKVNTDLEVIKISPKDIKIRNAIRRLNNLCASYFKNENKIHRLVPVDIQFDGNSQTNYQVQVIYNDNKVETAVKSTLHWDGTRKGFDEYHDYFTTAFNKTIKPTKQIQTEKFEKLNEAFQESGNKELLIDLITLAFAAMQENSYCYEAAEDYCEYAKKYINLALKSEDKKIIEDATILQEEHCDYLSDSAYKI